MPYTVRFFREGSIEVDCHWLDGNPTHSIAISHPVVSGGARSLFLVPRKWAIPCEESKDPRPWPVFFFWSSFLLFLSKVFHIHFTTHYATSVCYDQESVCYLSPFFLSNKFNRHINTNNTAAATVQDSPWMRMPQSHLQIFTVGDSRASNYKQQLSPPSLNSLSFDDGIFSPIHGPVHNNSPHHVVFFFCVCIILFIKVNTSTIMGYSIPHRCTPRGDSMLVYYSC